MSQIPAHFLCYLVQSTGDSTHVDLAEVNRDQLPPGEVTIRVWYSSLNYKDALAASGHPGVALRMPLVPGIDAIGIVVESAGDEFSVGDTVFVSAADFGTRHWGGWSEYVRVPAEWCYPLPTGLSVIESIALGTAGFTAAQSVEKLQEHGIQPDSGPVVVSGATGGVGIFAVMLLHSLGFQVVASTGKPENQEWLRQAGASDVISRDELNDKTSRPLLSGRWAGGIDTVGGNTLGTILRSTSNGGCVTACGLVAGHQLELTVYPFILRGVCLQGIDSANVSRPECQRIWNRLASDYKMKNIESIVTRIPFNQVQSSIDKILAGGVSGRTVLEISGD